MAKFFRKFRMQLINKSTGKYLLYALGEITLIIIGILLAMKINNINEAQKRDRKVNAILLEIQHDLANDLVEVAQIIKIYEYKDSLIQQVQAQQLTTADYLRRTPSYLGLVTTFQELVINDNGYQSLIRNIDNLSSKHAPLLEELNQLYIHDKKSVYFANQKLGTFCSKTLEKWADKHTWLSQLNRGKITKECADYFANDPFYQNEVAIYKDYAVGNLLRAVKRFRHNAVLSYQAIAKFTQTPKEFPSFITDYIFPLSPQQQQSYLGTFVAANGFGIDIGLEGDQLYIQGTGQGKIDLYPRTTQNFFTISVPTKLVFQQDESGKVTGFTLHQNGVQTPFERRE